MLAVQRYDLTQNNSCKQSHSEINSGLHQFVLDTCSQLKSHGVHSAIRMKSCGFQYTGEGDTARCTQCNLELSGWTLEMDPFHIHAERNPHCSFVQLRQSKYKFIQNAEENPTKRRKLEFNNDSFTRLNKSFEINSLTKARRQTFSDYLDETLLLAEQMIRAGFFKCNVGDRVICLYCNLICQKWKVDIDDPVEVHKILSPKCPYVLYVLAEEEHSPTLVVNEFSTDNNINQAFTSNNTNRTQLDQIVHTSPCNNNYANIPSRQATFTTWKHGPSPSIDDLVNAGFYYSGIKNIVQCFYCNGSLQTLGENDNPLIEHIKWFPHCSYAKQLSGDELYNKVQIAKSIQRGCIAPGKSQLSTNTTSEPLNTHRQELQVMDEQLLSRLVAARLDLPISQRLLDKNFKLSIIKRCWEDQLRLKHDDFVNEYDLFIACTILQRQIEHINGNKDNIIVPSIKMQSIIEHERSDKLIQEQSVPSVTEMASTNNSVAKVNGVIQTASSVTESKIVSTTHEQNKPEEIVSKTKLSVNNPCILCWKEEKRLACIPCGHLATCVDCSQTIRTCPICRKCIEAFVRVYI
ncbi:unnamed protein product [Rotaria magnacalcarata]|uniref:RING-type domain-containing protein n=1 Tax=Rotaria magnacalcarata TaxID=392030 RepID=A0A820G441_9BILA|nr:unnamed protein product [Rotaria magnacalcarata]